ncbi:hypothetical protein FB45DRAFT_719545, partial [Roridomyces roridus]
NIDEADIVSITRQLVQLEAKMMAMSFSAAGCLYYTKDLERVDAPRVALDDARFSVGPDSSWDMWCGRRSKLDVYRGPYKTAESYLLGGADKELEYLKQFGRPRPSLSRIYRAADGDLDKKQQPADHIANLMRYKLIAPFIIPKDPTLSRFTIHHHNLNPFNILVSRSPADSSLKIVGLVDFQHNPILPFFLHSSLPKTFSNEGDKISESMTPPTLPDGVDDLTENDARWAREHHRRRLLHYNYMKQIEEHNPAQYSLMRHKEPIPRYRELMVRTTYLPWLGDSLTLRFALSRVNLIWAELCEDEDILCPIAFEPEEAELTKWLMDIRQEMIVQEARMYGDIDCSRETWQSVDRFDDTFERAQMLRQ